MNTQAIENKFYTLELKRDLNAPVQDVFRAWTDPNALLKWFGPQGVNCESADVDLVVGGTYRLTLDPPDGERTVVHGTYREIEPPHRLVFTWVLDDQGCAGSADVLAETLVTITLEALGATTRLTLTQTLLPTDASRDSHTQGWQGCLDSLASAV